MALRTEHCGMVHFVVVFVLVEFLAAVVFYYKAYDYKRSGETSEVVYKNGIQDRYHENSATHEDKSGALFFLIDRAKRGLRFYLDDSALLNVGLLLENKDKSIAEELARKVRVLCWVMTQPSNHDMVKHIKATWGRRCNILLFMSTARNKKMPMIVLLGQEGEEYRWTNIKAEFRYVYEHHRDDADWFMKADDDTYVIVENLRYMLADYSSNSPIYFGCRFVHEKQGYLTGGAGYVLSRAALDRLVQQGLEGQTHCGVHQDGQEDFDMGKCLSKIGVSAGDSRDSLRRGQFFPVADHLVPNQDINFWYWNYIYYPTRDGLDCCSEYAISFHYIQPNDMYVLDYLVYQLRPYGIQYKHIKKPKILDNNKIKSKNAILYNSKLGRQKLVKNVSGHIHERVP